jgi:hypothetical protein
VFAVTIPPNPQKDGAPHGASSQPVSDSLQMRCADREWMVGHPEVSAIYLLRTGRSVGQPDTCREIPFAPPMPKKSRSEEACWSVSSNPVSWALSFSNSIIVG